MPEPERRYYGTYCRLDARSGDSIIELDGNMLSIGQVLELHHDVHVTGKGKEVERVIVGASGRNAAGFLPQGVAQNVIPLLQDGWSCRAVASAIVFNKLEDSYWCEVGVVCMRPDDRQLFDVYLEKLSGRIAGGAHPQVRLSGKQVDQLFEHGGDWVSPTPADLPTLEKGSAFYKKRRTFAESAARKAADNNRGCYVGLVAAIVVVVVAIVVYFVFLR